MTTASQVEMLRFYLRDLRLVNGDGEAVMSRVKLLDLGHPPSTYN